MILRTEAVVLDTLRYGETSLIVGLFTRTQGRVSVLAKGVRGPKSRLSGVLQAGNCIEVVYGYKGGRSLQTLREAAFTFRFDPVRDELRRRMVRMRMLELVRALLPEGQAHPEVFDVLTHTLIAANVTEGDPRAALAFFGMRLAGLMGFGPRFTRDAVNAITERGVLHLSDGTITPFAEDSTAIPTSRLRLRAFATFTRTDLETALRVHLEEDDMHAVLALVERYLGYHTQDAYPKRSDEVREMLMQYGNLPEA